MENNPAYEVPQLQEITTSRRVHTTTLSATGIVEEPVSLSGDHEYEDISSVKTNDTHSHL